MTLSCAMIVRNEAANLRECLESVRPHVDELVIVDTGSVDGTPDIAREFADKFEVYLGCNDEEGRIRDFSDARNKSFDLASGDWICWVDGDDILVNGDEMRKLAEADYEDDNIIFTVPYEYQYAPDGSVEVLHHRERLMRPRHQFGWVCPVHEGCLPRQPVEGTVAHTTTDVFHVKHRAQYCGKDRDPGRNLRILREHVQRSGEGDIRALYYLGLEWGYNGDAGMSLNWLKRYVELAQWSDEKCQALLAMAKIYLGLKDFRSAESWALQALATKSWPDPYWLLSRTYYDLAVNGFDDQYNFKRAAHHARQGLKLSTGGSYTVLSQSPREHYAIHEVLNVCLYRLGDIEAAVESCCEGLKGLPNNELLKGNLREYDNYRRKCQIVQNVDELVDQEALSKQAATIIKATLKGDFKVELLDEPTDMPSASPEPQVMEAPEGGLSIVFFLGHNVEPWNPDTWAKGGMGGSETMAWHMSRLLAKRGHKVRLYGHCTPTQEGTFEGVEFLDETKFRNVHCDVLVASRRPDAVDNSFGCQARARLLWVHDIHMGEALNMTRALRFDRILALSEWHQTILRKVYGGIDPKKVFRTRNGIDLSLFEGEEERDPHRAVYSSSPDRGLQTALDCWPRVRKEVPDATLHVYYGFKTWEVVARAIGDGNQVQSIQHLQHLLRNTTGVIWHDRISQTELAKEFMRSGVWGAPNWFQETSCITAMEAQAAGLYMVTSPIAALNETAGDRAYLCKYDETDQGCWRSEQYMQEWSGAVVAAMQADDGFANNLGAVVHRSDLKQYAKENFGLDALADEWDAMIRGLVDELAECPVPRFHGVAV